MVNARYPAPPESGTRDGPSSSAGLSTRTCPGCVSDVDPLRAGHVAILEGRFLYFCRAECKEAYLLAQGRPSEELVPTAAPPVASYANGSSDGGVTGEIHPRESRTEQDTASAPRLRPGLTPAAGIDFESYEEARAEPPVVPSRPTLPSFGAARPPLRRVLASLTERRAELFSALDGAGIVCGVLVPAIGLLGPAADAARLPLAVASWVALVFRIVRGGRDAADPHPLVVLAPTTGAVGAACWANAVHEPHAAALTVFAALSCAVGVVVEILVGRAGVRVQSARARIERALDVRVRALRDGHRVDLPASEVRPGEPILVEPGEIVGVDATITAGEARIVPWLGARVEFVRREGDPVLAGARVVSSPLRMTTTWSGRDRAWLKLLSSRTTRIDVASPTASAVRHTVERGAPLAAIVVGIASLAANATPVEVLAAMCAGAIAFAAKSACSVVALHFSRAHLDALASGITYKDAPAFERAAAASLAVLSARGSVLLGEPEIVAIEAVGAVDVERVLSLAAGAEAVANHPFAAAVSSAARMRGLAPDHVRNATVHAGLGITAMAPGGERLVVGGRAIMLEEKIGVALIETRVSELEAEGRSVLLVALGDRLIGLIALQDGLRPGARAAIQKLLDARIEPVLLCGEARDTCETIGRALDIEHVRPEVLPGDRAAEVRALAESGSVVAVIGHPAGDDGALGAADVAVAMGGAGSTPGEWAVVVASEDVRDAALALAIPHAARDRARIAIALGATPGLIALLGIAFGVAPLAAAPIAVLLAAVAVAVHAREAHSGLGIDLE